MATSNQLLIAPAPSHSTSHTQTSHSAPSAPGIHDTLRASLAPSNALYSQQPASSFGGYTSHTQNSTLAEHQSAHPLADRLSHFPQTQTNLQYALLKRSYGISAPLIREMELGIVRGGDCMRAGELAMGPGMGLGSVNGGRGRSVHEDVLLGRDCEIDGWEDIFGIDAFAPMPDFHTQMERQMRMDW